MATIENGFIGHAPIDQQNHAHHLRMGPQRAIIIIKPAMADR